MLAGTGVDYAAGLRSSDPRRIAVYFSKHASFAAKEYQNDVPEEWREPGKGPGRFWGFWGLERCTRAVEVTPDAATLAARTMRRWAHAQGVTQRDERAPVAAAARSTPRSCTVMALASAGCPGSSSPRGRSGAGRSAGG